MQAKIEPHAAYCRTDTIQLDADTIVCRITCGASVPSSIGGPQHQHRRVPMAEHPALATFILQRRFELLAQTNPGAVAIQCGGCKLTYGELDVQADGLAALLQQRGIGSGNVVAIRMAPSIAMARAVLAVLKSGGASLVLDPAQPPAQLDASLAAWDAALVLTAFDAAPLPLPPSRQLRCTEDGAGLPFAWPEEHPIDRLSPAYARQDGPAGDRRCFGSHLSVLDQLLAIQALSPIRQGDSLLQSAAASSSAFPLDALWALSHGAKLLVAAPGETDDPGHLRQLIRREHVAAMHVMPALRTLLDREPGHADLSSLHTLFCAVPMHA